MGYDARFHLPSNMMVVGPTSSGKTQWLKKLVQNISIIFSTKPECLLLFYKEWQPSYDDIQRQMIKNSNKNKAFLKFSSIPNTVEEMKELLDMLPKNTPKIVIFDDYLDEVGTVLKHFFTVLTHHYNCFTVFICQSLFNSRSELRTLSINSQYMVLFNNPRDRSGITHLAKQVFPNNVSKLVEAYKIATEEKAYSYLLLDFHQQQHNRVRLRSNIFPSEWPAKVYTSSI